MVNLLKALLVVLLSTCLLIPCLADQQSQSAPVEASNDAPAKKAAQSVEKADSPTQTAAPKPSSSKSSGTASSAKTTQRAPVKPLRTEAELSGFTSETSDRLQGRISLVNTQKNRQWWIKTGYGQTKSRTYYATRTHETTVSTFNLDSEYRSIGKDSYRFVSAAAHLRARSPHSSSYYDNSGYHLISAGYGKKIMNGTDLELAIAHIAQRRDDVERSLAPVCSLRIKTPLSSAMNFDSDIHMMQPGSADFLIDSRSNLTYKLSPAVRLRLTYVLNNILGSTLTRSRDWDKSLRLSLVFTN